MVFAHRVFEQQSISVELRLNLFEPERLRLDQRGIVRTGLADGGLRPFVIGLELANLFLEGVGVFGFRLRQ